MTLDVLLKVKPDQHQVEAYQKVERLACCALFMDRGTGKTLVAIAKINRWTKKKIARRTLIVTTKSFIGGWKKEFDKFSKLSHKFLLLEDGFNKDKTIREFWGQLDEESNHIIICSYDSLRLYSHVLRKFYPDVVVLDESQKIKSRTTRQSKAAHSLTRVSQKRMILSGTPAHESPADLWSQFKFLNPDILSPKYAEFEQRYIIRDPWYQYRILGYRNLGELSAIIAPHSFVVSQEVLALPSESVISVKFELSETEREYYKSMMKDFTVVVTENQKSGRKLNAPNILSQLSKLQQMCSGFIMDVDGESLVYGRSKVKAAVKLIEEIDSPTVVFYKYRKEAEMLSKRLEKMGITYDILDGQSKNRSEKIENFQSGEFQIFLVQIKVGGAAITLTKASTSVFFSFGYSLTDFDQAKARIYRRGQTEETKHYLMVAEKTIEEEIVKALSGKQKLARAILNSIKNPSYKS